MTQRQLLEQQTTITCNVCGFTGSVDDFDCIGACANNVFCLNCGTEIDVETGLAGERCGKCYGCGFDESFVFAEIQEKRHDKKLSQKELF
jgi:DNA-directed RNA polymerase subunit RPC12/RpoP